MELLDIPMDAIMHIKGKKYNQVKTSDIKKGDLVLDLSDGMYTTVAMKHDDKHFAIKTGEGAELGVDIKRLRKLVQIK